MEVKSKVIGSHTYYVRALGSKSARGLLVRLLSTLGPVLGAAVPQGVSFREILNSNIDFGKALNELSARLKESDLDFACAVLGDATEVDIGNGRRIHLTLEAQELHFCGGKLSELMKWLQFALEVQFSDFFSDYTTGQSA